MSCSLVQHMVTFLEFFKILTRIDIISYHSPMKLHKEIIFTRLTLEYLRCLMKNKMI